MRTIISHLLPPSLSPRLAQSTPLLPLRLRKYPSFPLTSVKHYPSRSPSYPIRFSSQFTPTTDLELEDDMGKDKEKSGKESFTLKVPKGTRDWAGADSALRDKIFSKVTKVFKRHGAETLDTPVFELREILSGKYGEDSKLIYDLQDQGGELCSLRYDLTVPLARYLAMNPSIQTFKRYQIAKVYRRDQPAMTKGRMREFYQCDIDIAGVYDSMIPDAQVLRIATEVFQSLGWENYTIKINHRKILDGIFKVAGVPEPLIRPISSAVDKLDKLPWADVKKEMIEKTLDAAVADKIWEFVQHKGKSDIIDLLRKDENMSKNEDIIQGTKDMETLFSYLEVFGVMDRISFDLSLARGLDYYTGVIYEIVTEGSAPSGKGKGEAAIGVGSVAAGGRYDELVGMFSGKPIPCVGISFGVDRIISIVKARGQTTQRAKDVDAFVMAFGGKGFNGMLLERMQIARQLWDAGVKTEFSYKVKPKLQQQFKTAETSGVPLAVILGEDEWKEGKVKLKEMGLPEDHPDKNGVLVDIKDLVAEVRKRIKVEADEDIVEGTAALKV
ncbi:histidyl-tRNA synthetase [Aaosphaeria arxii CBS 175.79]|uniref:Histidine--tRNA ligase, mitochondrial n=1 Tax=Aaosphaeria arxii CBS 175.79 TaxID=1450172 RepID=A0A6A5Y4T3_9PLEO|nr:histidyl-tRNA synthetase [Aaosphaeria arxii CBS 175.79]KAF2020269.1 histidyl-tRNA synthetase [Aaosphaeria arxii CBS 175.79]